MMKPIVVLGSSNTDMTVQVQRIPRPGETVIGGLFLMAQGGKGANQAVAAARAGGRVAFIGRVGDDLFGTQALESLQRDHVDVTCVVRAPNTNTGVALIFVGDAGENSIAVASGANADVDVADVQAARALIEDAAVLLVQLEIPLPAVTAAIDMARARGVPVILNPAPALPLAAQLLRDLDILTPNETEAEVLSGIRVDGARTAHQAARALQGRGVRRVLITMGARGVFVADETRSELVPCFDVSAVDTTGAGDVFNGALAVALSEDAGLMNAVRFASAAAALSVATRGAQTSAPRREAIEAFLAAREQEV